MYSVSGNIITYVSDIYADGNNTALNNSVYSAAFSPNGKTLVLIGYFTGKAKVYSVNGNSITYVSNIYANGSSATLGGEVNSVVFSPDGKTLILGGTFSGKAKVYSVNGNTITYINDIYADGNNTALSSSVYSAAFSPDGKTLILGGSFTGKAKVYSVNGTTITYVSDIYADNSNTALSSTVWSAAFSPDSKLLVLGGLFTGRAKIYSVNGNTITYVSDIYAGNNTTTLSSHVYSVTFSPDGNTLVLGGLLGEKAKVYSVDGTTLTYISNIYADGSGSILGNAVYSATFSPDGKTLVLSGDFAGYGRVYSIDGTTVYYSPIAYVASDGEFTELPLGSKLGFAKSTAKIGEEVTVKTIGSFAMPYSEGVKF
jgi:WD40 repeat protein